MVCERNKKGLSGELAGSVMVASSYWKVSAEDKRRMQGAHSKVNL